MVLHWWWVVLSNAPRNRCGEIKCAHKCCLARPIIILASQSHTRKKKEKRKLSSPPVRQRLLASLMYFINSTSLGVRRRRSKFSGADHRDPCPWVSLFMCPSESDICTQRPIFYGHASEKGLRSSNLNVIPSRRSVPVDSMVLHTGVENHQTRIGWGAAY